MSKEYNASEIAQLNDLASFLSYKRTPIVERFLRSPHKVTGLFTGNQFGKTAVAAYSCVLSILGQHPVPEKNVDYFRCECGQKWNVSKAPKDGKCPVCGGAVTMFCNPVRVFRFASETLPGETTDAKGAVSTEVRNTQYPEFSKWCPPFLIKKNITARSPKMVLRSAVSGKEIIVEYVSYNQSIQSTAGSQKFLVWEDEEAPRAFHQEQLPRLLAADGFVIITLTPANFLSWTHDEIFERASAYYRSDAIAKKFNLKPVEIVRNDSQIAVFQAATDDNPTLRPDVIERLFENYDDEDVIAIRRYGVFKQISGRIFKTFDWNVHVINEDKYFPDGIPHEGFHARGVDYHGRTPWACGWLWLSNDDELFIFDELNPSPEQMVTEEIARHMATISKDYRYRLDLMDPLAEAAQPNTGTSVMDDMNRYFLQYKREGLCTGAYWQGWNTKSERGRDSVAMRLKNSITCGKPFNNLQVKNGKKEYLPTIWIFSRCKNFANSFKNWRWEEWADASSQVSKEEKNTPQQKFSHFPMVVEGLLKDQRFRPCRGDFWKPHEAADSSRYFKRERIRA